MSNIALIQYSFMFDTGEGWTNLYQFEGTLVKYFDSLGYEADILKTVEGARGMRILMLKKKPMVTAPTKAPVGRPQSMGSKFKEMATRKLRKPALEFKKKK